jgi:S1-C subfamily serine protease
MYNSIEVIKQVVKLNNKCKKLKFTKTKDATPGRSKFNTTMGVMPDYSYSGKGMRIDGVSDNKPAFKAGLMRNDIIVKLGENIVTGVEDYMVALSKFNTGDKTTATIIRGTETLTKEIQF